MTVRLATSDDLDFVVALAEERRQEYERHAPVFHRRAADAQEVHRPWLARLIASDDVAVLVHVSDQHGPDGFVVATLVPPPPVYDPGGDTCSIDDFAVSAPDRWEEAGRALLRAAQAWARERGAAQTVVVCGPHDEPKRRMLRQEGLAVVSEWYAAPLR